MKKIILLAILAAVGFYVAWPAFSGYQIHSALASGDAKALAGKIDFASVRQSMRAPVLAKIDDRLAGFMKGLGPAAGALGGKQIAKDKIEAIVDGALAEVIEPARIVSIYGKGGDYAGAMQEAVVKQIDKLGGVGALFGGGKGSGGAPAAGGGGFGGIKLPGGLGNAAGKLGGLMGGGNNIPGLPGGAGDLIGKLGLDAGKIAQMLFPKGAQKSVAPGAGAGGSSFGLSNIKSFGFAGPLGLQMGVAGSAAAKGPDVTAGMEFRGFDWKVTRLEPHL
jgi:hypothetical protein